MDARPGTTVLEVLWRLEELVIESEWYWEDMPQVSLWYFLVGTRHYEEFRDQFWVRSFSKSTAMFDQDGFRSVPVSAAMVLANCTSLAWVRGPRNWDRQMPGTLWKIRPRQRATPASFPLPFADLSRMTTSTWMHEALTKKMSCAGCESHMVALLEIGVEASATPSRFPIKTYAAVQQSQIRLASYFES